MILKNKKAANCKLAAFLLGIYAEIF